MKTKFLYYGFHIYSRLDVIKWKSFVYKDVIFYLFILYFTLQFLNVLLLLLCHGVTKLMPQNILHYKNLIKS